MINSTNWTTAATPPLQTEAAMLWKVFPPVLIIIGTVGNVLSIIVLSRPSMVARGVSIYFLFLSLSDLFVLYTGLLRQWIVYMFDFDIRDSDPFLCKVNLWMVYFSLDLSAWILVSATIKRVVFVWLPHRVDQIYTKKVVAANILVVVVVLLIINGHFLVGVDRLLNKNNYECKNRNLEYGNFRSHIFPWIDLFLFCLGPFCFIIVGNIAIIYGLHKSARFRGTRIDSKQRASMRMLMYINVTYLSCTLPVSSYFIYDAIWQPEDNATTSLVYACVNILMYINNATNFIAYIVCGKQFWLQLAAICCRKRLRLNSRNSLVSASSLSRSRNIHSSSVSTIC